MIKIQLKYIQQSSLWWSCDCAES